MIVMRHQKTGEVHIVESAEGYGKGWVNEGAVPEGVDPHLVMYDKATRSIIIDLTAPRDAKWAEIKERRNFATFGLCDTPFGPIQADLVSRQMLRDAAHEASLTGLERLWTMADNSQRLLKPEDFQTILSAIDQHTQRCHAQGREIRAAIDEASTIAEFDAIHWPDQIKETEA